MFKRDDVTYEFHHLGVPTAESHPGERYSAVFGMYTSDSESELVRIQYHRFDTDSILHPVLRTMPHVAFKVDDLARAIDGKQVVLGPYEPIDGFRVAVIVDGGMPVELIQTTLSDEQVWSRAHSGEQASIYFKGESHADR
ncbi:VOC family protein [Caballeronia humi]|uniref:Glyoxalase/bleomycin resistance protein/dioxygenase n=1 Tax=Caballeronia humi TaxID=326474 RepID=A0A158G5F1_9BURK|nr:hypothetical protein [Caballeronia humi]SAL26849.1 hypothetical protein AWB65_01542 [Caballeronia humi]